MKSKFIFYTRVLLLVALAAACGRDTEIGGAVNFDFKLADAGVYTALLWADFVKASAAGTDGRIGEVAFTHYPDCHYATTANLTNITLATAGNAYTVNDDSRDAFFARAEIEKGAGVYNGSVTLARALGQLNLVEKNAALLPALTSVTLAYAVPGSFDVATGTPGAAVAVNPAMTPGTDAASPLLRDYILAPAAPAQTTLGKMAMTFESNEADYIFAPFDVPANIPVARNRRTYATGSLLHRADRPSDEFAFTITLTDGWSDDRPDVPLFRVPDPAFRRFCTANGYADADGYIIPSASAAVSGTLDASNAGIFSLAGIEFFTGITGLNCSYNNLTTLDLSACPALTSLDCSCNNLAALDLTQFPLLEKLNCAVNEKLAPPDIAACPKLIELYCDQCGLTSLNLKNCPALKILSCSGNSLTVLDVTTCPLLTGLYCNGCGLTSLDLTGCPALEILFCSGNSLDGLDVTTCPLLTELDCVRCGLTSLDLTGCRALEILYCSGNSLDGLDVTVCSLLTELGCVRCGLTSLDLTECPALVSLFCLENSLTVLDVSGCTVLTSLDCNYNRLSELDASKMTADEHGNWSLFCGRQTNDGSTPRELTLTLHENQRAYWESELQNRNYGIKSIIYIK